MDNRLLKRTSILFLFLIAIGVIGCSGSAGSSKTSKATPVVSPSANSSVKIGTLSPTIDTIVRQVLTNMHQHAWNPQAMTHSVITGGLFINWKMNDPSMTNAVKAGPDRNPQHNHDPQVDLLYLTSLVEYQQIHPQDHTYDIDLQQALSLVLADFKNYNLPKGWIYFDLLKDGLMLHNPALINEAHMVASNFYTHWYDPKLGIIYNRNHTPGDYSVDHTIDCGAALIDAGMRWNFSDWISAGEKTLDHTLSAALDPYYHLFYNSMLVSSNGQERVQNYQAKPSTQGEAVDSLVIAYTLTHNQQYLNVAGQVLQSLFGTSGLWDKTHGGFYFALDMSKNRLLTSYKETRSQTLTLAGLNYYNQVAGQAFAQQEQELASVIVNDFYQHTYHGFFYRITADFQVYRSAVGQGIGVEDYFTTEAMGSAMDALQQTEMVMS